MFRKLKIRLTLINLTTVLLILTFIFAGTYILLNKQLNSQVDNIMNEFLKMGSEGKIPDLSNIPKPPNMGKQNNPPEIFNCFVVKVNSSGKLIEASQNNILSEIDTNELIRNTMGSSQLKGSISMSFGTFRYISSVKQQSKLIVFYNESMQKSFLNLLIVIFIIIGIIGVFLAFLSSYFVANKALVPIKQAWHKGENLCCRCFSRA